MPSEISLYIHIPFCKSKCIYCDFFSRPGCENLIDDYVDALSSELAFHAENLSGTKLKTVYIGGGTPSLLSIEQMNKVFSVIKEKFILDENDFEFTIELNPDDVNEELILFLEKSIVTRISLGIQTLKEETLKFIERRASRKTCVEALLFIKENFTKRFSVDLISSLPGETENDVKSTIDEIVKFSPEHISLYSLCIEENTKLYRMIQDKKAAFDADYSDALWIRARDYLKSKGYVQYEVSNFSKDEKARARHNLAYWHLKSYIGAGSGATGTFFYREKDSLRYTNTRDIKQYIEYWKNLSHCEKIPREEEFIDKHTEEFEYIMMNMRLLDGFSKKDYEERFCMNSTKIFDEKNDLIKSWMDKKLIEKICKGSDVFYRMTEQGILYLNSFLEKI